MHILFYLFVLYFICFEFFQLFPSKGAKEYQEMDTETVKALPKAEIAWYGLYTLWVFLTIAAYWLITMVGILMSNQRLLFAGVLIISVTSLIMKRKAPEKVYKVWSSIDCVLCIILLSAIIVNKFFL